MMSAPPVEGVSELGAVLVNDVDHARYLLELADGVLQLPIEHAAVGDDDDRTEDALILVVVQGRQPVRQPGDGVALTAAGAVLDEIVLPRAVRAGVRHQFLHRIALMVARENQTGRLVAVFYVQETAHQFQHASGGEDVFPQVGTGVAIGVGRIARAAVAAAVEGQKAGARPFQFGGQPDFVIIHREMRADGGGIAGAARSWGRGLPPFGVLLAGVRNRLTGEFVLEFEGEDGQAVEGR